MAIWNRKPKVDETTLAKIIAEEVKSALGPYQAAGGSVVANTVPTNPSGYSGGGGQGLLQTPGTPAMPLPRPGEAFGSQLGPAMPFLPAPLDPVFDDSGRALPRKYQYQVAWNLNIDERMAPWGVLRALSEQCDVIHRCIEIRAADIASKDLAFTVSDQAITKIMEEEQCGHAKANQIARDRYSEVIDGSQQFWENPYVHGDRGWAEWITEAAWNHFVYDAICVYPRFNLGKEVIGFELIDPSTIKVLLDNRGDLPHPPAPAFQQILWGFPRGEYQASSTNDGEFFADEGEDGEFIRDQLSYFVKNRRTWTPYGYGPVEQSIPAANLYLERQVWMRSEYTEGTIPTTFMKTDSEELDHLKLASLERVMNDTLTGQSAERHRIKMLPKGFDPMFAPSIDERYKSDYDEFLIKRIASAFGVMPTQLGIIPHTGLGGRGQQQGEQDQAESMSRKPTEQFLVDMINSLNHRFRGVDRSVTATFGSEDTPDNESKRAEGRQVSLYSGQKTLNDIRSEEGEPLYDMPEADEPFIVAGSQVIFLRGMLGTDTVGETVNPAPMSSQADIQATPAEMPTERTQVMPQANLTEPVAKAVDYEEVIPERSGEPADRELYDRCIEAAKEKFDVYPSAVANAWVVGEYKRRGGTYRAKKAAESDSHTPPKGVQEEAQRALEWIKQGHAGDGFTDTGRKRASDLAAGHSVSMETIKRMASFFARHEVDKRGEGFSPGEDGYPSPGRVAWAAWGGDAGKSWADSLAHSDKAAELKTFKAFVAKRAKAGKWRDFSFEAHDPATAEFLNEQGRNDVEKASRSRRPLVVRYMNYQEPTT